MAASPRRSHGCAKPVAGPDPDAMPDLKITTTDSPPPGWDDMIASAGGEGNFHQTTAKAEGSRVHDKSRSWYLTVSDASGAPVALALVLRMHLLNQRTGRKRFPLPYLRCRGGPVWLDRECAADSLKLILKRTAALARRCGAMYVDFQGLAPTSAHLEDPATAGVFRAAGYQASKWATLLVDLDRDDDGLWQGLNRAARKCVNKCRRGGVEIISPPDYEAFQRDFWEPYSASEAAAGRETYAYPAGLWRATEERISFHVARTEDGRPLAYLGLLRWGGLATEISSGSDPLSFELKLPAQDFLHWELMRLARDSGCHTFDLAGINPDPQTPKEQGIRRFKEKWGGRYVEYSTWRREMIPLAVRGLDAARRWRNKAG